MYDILLVDWFLLFMIGGAFVEWKYRLFTWDDITGGKSPNISLGMFIGMTTAALLLVAIFFIYLVLMFVIFVVPLIPKILYHIGTEFIKAHLALF